MRSLLFKIILIVSLFGVVSFAASSNSESPYIYVLGVAQDAGYPQAGCYEVHCIPGWKNIGLRRGAVSLGLIDPQAKTKYMFEATPNFPSQLYDLELEAPLENFKFSGIFLTHAHIGHYTGLMFLGHEAMGASNVPVFSMPRMARFLETNGPWSQLVKYKNISLVPLQDNGVQKLGSVKVTPFLVPHRDEYSETVGYRIVGPDKSAIFIPDINKWHEWKTDIAKLVTTVDYAFLDAGFFADGELPGRDMSLIPHPFVTETMETLKQLSREDRKKVWFIHMNHTNPMLNPNSVESQKVKSAGFNIAIEGKRFTL
ncbi:MBL fold metallo-hydrolase [Thalassotalea psychrophila]|uniref:MBL fold metallo-hydrolase n=1 Tax=Thalassotalea psychrophila TaxID=3065647 RepID=A0ABY9TU37_9GAMM|nr:MBL fold metallo-hydrolase [Colwelliaceae bacterium SQ149]